MKTVRNGLGNPVSGKHVYEGLTAKGITEDPPEVPPYPQYRAISGILYEQLTFQPQVDNTGEMTLQKAELLRSDTTSEDLPTLSALLEEAEFISPRALFNGGTELQARKQRVRMPDGKTRVWGDRRIGNSEEIVVNSIAFDYALKV